MSSDQRGPLGEAALLKTAGSVPGLVLKGFGMRKEPDLAVEGDVGDYSTETYAMPSPPLSPPPLCCFSPSSHRARQPPTFTRPTLHHFAQDTADTE